jgi:hypothetical protein
MIYSVKNNSTVQQLTSSRNRREGGLDVAQVILINKFSVKAKDLSK